MTTPAAAHPLSAPIAALLPARDDSTHALVAQSLAGQVRLLVRESWAALLQRCAESLPGPAAAALRAAACEAPEPDLLMTRLDSVVSPAVLLSLPVADQAGLADSLLAHPDAQLREQSLDALAGTYGCEPLRNACAAWSRRMLMAALGRIAGLSHSDRLRLQDEMLACGGEEPSGPAEARTLEGALRDAAELQAVAILAERAGVPREVIETAAALRDPKMLVSLCWKAGCNAAETLAVQMQLGRVPPGLVLRTAAGGLWPLNTPSMQWHIGVLHDIR